MIEPGVNQESMVKYVVDRWEQMESDRSTVADGWEDSIYSYACRHDKGWVAKAKAENRSYRFIPLMWDAVENVYAQMMAMILPDDNWFRLDPGRRGMDEDDDVMARQVELIMKAQHRQMGFMPEIAKLVKWLLICGNSTWIMDWFVQLTRDFKAYAKAMETWTVESKQAWVEYQMAMQQYQQLAQVYAASGLDVPPPPALRRPRQPVGDPSIAYAGPRLWCGNIFDYVQDPHGDDYYSSERITRFWRSPAYFKKRGITDESGYAIYDNLANVRPVEIRSGGNDSNRSQAIFEIFGMQTGDRKGILAKEMMGTFSDPLAGTDLDNAREFVHYVATVANDNTLIRFEPVYTWSRKLPRQLVRLIVPPGQLYGTGIVEKNLGTMDLVNVKSNQGVDASAIAINPEYKAVDDGVFNIDDPETGPGAIHVVGHINNVQPILRDLKGISWSAQEVAIYKAELQQGTRASNPFTSQHYKKSATEIARDSAITGSSLARMMKDVEEDGIRNILEMQMQLSRQFLSDEAAMAITQEDISLNDPKSPQAIRMLWDIKIVGSQGVIAKDQRIQNLMMLLQMAIGSPIMSSITNVQYVAELAFRELGFDEVDKIFPQALQEQLRRLLENPSVGLVNYGGGNNGGNQTGGTQGTPDGAGPGGQGNQGPGGAQGDTGVGPGLAELLSFAGAAGGGTSR